MAKDASSNIVALKIEAENDNSPSQIQNFKSLASRKELQNATKVIKTFVASVGVEPTTLGLLDPRSNQLSYEAVPSFTTLIKYYIY